eukprot:m.115203 g.115203  ORF g.115203 m.115203 type:complete len:445 (+) comp10870_c0_seq5:321-1655(+)
MVWFCLCCAAAGASFCCSSSMQLCCVTTSATATRVAYAIMFTISSIVAWIMLAGSIGEKLNSQRKFTGDIAACESGDNDQQCAARWSQLAVFRIMFAAFLFFGFMGMLMCGVRNSRDVRAAWQNGFWFFKVMLWIGLTVAAFFIPNKWFSDAWGYIGLAGACIYMIVQGTSIILFAHAWAAQFKSDDQAIRNRAGTTIPIGFMVATAFSFTVTVLLYVYYTYGDSRGGCERNKVLISMNLVLCILMYICGLASNVESTRGLLQPAVISAYTTYLTWSAVTQTTDRCLPTDNDPSDWLTLVIGFCLTLAIVLSASTVYPSEEALKANADAAEPQRDVDPNERLHPTIDNEYAMIQYIWWQFHWLIALACCFMQNVLTNWATIRTSDGGTTGAEVDAGDSVAPIWVQASAGYIVIAIYLWDVMGPSIGARLCPNRTFEPRDKRTYI